MALNNVYSQVKKVSQSDKEVQNYQFGSFIGGGNDDSNNLPSSNAILNDREINGNVDPVLVEVRKLQQQIEEVKNKVTFIENDGIVGREIDAQVVQAIKDLKQYAAFFEQATFQLESKILKTSVSLAQKIIQIEIGENSSAIAKQTINTLMNKVKTASKITIHLNPKDYAVLASELKYESYIDIQEDANVTAGGVVIASDLGNFDGNIEAKVNSLIESLELVM
jgi:flagellar assembly protein FliH